MDTIKDIEDGMANVMLHPAYQDTLKEYERLLGVMGNVDGNEVIALVILSAWNASTILEK